MILEPPELAERLKVPVNTLAQWRYRGVGPKYMVVGRHVRYRESDIEHWLDSQTRGGDTPDAAA